MFESSTRISTDTEREAVDESLLQEFLENPLKYFSEFLFPPFSDYSSKSLDGSDRIMPGMDDHDHHNNHDMNENTFCNPMMTDEHSRRLHGVGVMTMGGDMSKGMVMYMDGFRFAMAGNQPCLNLYFSSWTLDTHFKFVVCLAFVFLLSFATEGVSKYRHTLTAARRPSGRQARRTQQIVISSLHGAQAFLGYIVMLATMTFSVEILFSVVLGLSAGYYHYFAGEIGLEGHVTTNPCCNYMQDESNDHEQAHIFQQQQQSASGDSMTADLLNSATANSNNGSTV